MVAPLGHLVREPQLPFPAELAQAPEDADAWRTASLEELDQPTKLFDRLAGKQNLPSSAVLFSISARAGGLERDTSKMIQRDLARARQLWLDEARDAQERQRREASDFLAYQNHEGLYADFHSLRHFSITSLERSGVSPKMAQTLARHSDIRLTLGVYTHVALHDQAGVIQSLPAPCATSASR